MEISANLVQELRKLTDEGIMECKRALVKANGDLDAAVKLMREAGQAKAGKKASAITAEGLIKILTSADRKQAVMLEVNCQTDFVAKDTNFKQFVDAVAAIALQKHITDIETLSKATMPKVTQTVEEARIALVAKVGENVSLRRIIFMTADHPIATYVHGDRIGVLVTSNASEEVGKDVAMHIAASRPEVVLPEQVDATRVAEEKAIFVAQAKTSGKADDIIEKMVVGRLKKFVGEISLYGQAFVKQPDITVEQLLNAHRATVHAFHRFEVGEGIEKKQGNFRDEVMAQVKAAQ